ncbi:MULTISPECIES: hypothetical protein [Aminobacterium]|jgi:hypothetical protein|nr:hypothetical protein [Aminobacterium sp. UBA4987]MDD2379839.1 hypothetical protein [Aminobacterium colombiense]MDD4266544.1 hypothetical protein [Aminobacterium colombiense]
MTQLIECALNLSERSRQHVMDAILPEVRNHERYPNMAEEEQK